MQIEMGSKTIIYGWHNEEPIKHKIIHNQIAEMISLGIHFGQFYFSNDGLTDQLGWFVDNSKV